MNPAERCGKFFYHFVERGRESHAPPDEHIIMTGQKLVGPTDAYNFA